MKVEKIADWNIKLIRQSYQNAIDKVNEDLGLTGGLGRITYDREGDRFSGKLEIFVGNPDRILWNKHCHKYGMKSEHFGQTFIYMAQRYKIDGIKSRRCEYPILAKNLDTDVRHKFPVSTLHTVTLIQEIEQ
jgi:hypothetical protein